MHSASRSFRYGTAAAALIAAILLRWSVDPWLGDKYPLATLFGAVGVTVWVAGLWPAIVVTVVGYACAAYLFISPRGSLALGGTDDAIAFAMYLFTCAMLIGFGEGVRRARAKVEAAAQYLHRALVGARVVAWEWEPAGNRLSMTENATDFFGLRGPLAWPEQGLPYLHPDDAAVHADAVRRSLKSGDDYYCTYRVIRPVDGRTIWVEDHGTVSRNSAGRAVRLAGVTVDITARKELEELLQQRADELHEADRRKNDFLALLAHELRNPLAPMRTSLQIMKMVDTDGVTAGQRAIMDRQISSIARLIDDLMDVSRIDRGKIKLHREVVNLHTLIREAIETAQPAVDEKRHRLTVELPPDPMYVDADATRIVQAVGNLLLNACKFTQEGGHITVRTAREREQAAITVRDDGIGIAPEHLERIFERFVQLDASLERVAGGLGIGLTLVKTLVELHAGTVSAASAGEGRGSEFTIRLPLAPAPPRAPERRAVSVVEPIGPRAARRVLVVDDNADAAESLALILRLRGHEVRTADRGATSIEIGAEFRPHVVILDLGMPGMNGYDTAQQIRAEPWGRKILLVALTGWGQPDDVKRSAEAGFDHHLTKPADLERLSRLIDAVPVAAA